jgi:hypothetical protein
MFSALSFSYKGGLWLPIAYQQHYPRLVEAANKVSELDSCHHLLTGTLSEHKTSQKEVVFTFRCRGELRKVFNVTVSAKNLGVIEIPEIWSEQDRIEKEAEKQRALRQRLADRDKYWAVCYETFQDETRTFNQVTVITPVPPKPEFTSEGGFIYLIEFRTLSVKKNPLSYLATAEINHLSGCSVKIRPI